MVDQPNPEAASQEPTNPWDVEALRAAPGDDDILTERVMHHLAVRKPPKTMFFRVHPDAAYMFDAYILERERGVEKDAYLVVPAVNSEIAHETTKRRIFTCVDRAGEPFLWAAKLPAPSNPANSWTSTALEIAESAKTFWVRMIPNMAAKHYEESRALGPLDEPKWPDKPFEALLKLAFKDKLIADFEHETLRELRGEQ